MKRLLFLIFPFFVTSLYGQSSRYILDADTGNEMDDYYAIVRALVEPDFDVIGLNSAQYDAVKIFQDSVWNGEPVKEFSSVKVSQQLNETILATLDRSELPHPLGSPTIFGYAWGYYKGARIPQSAASDFIIAEARKHSPENRLNVITIGASTNVAAAIAKAPEIADRLSVYLLGTQYNPETKIWNKSEFNIRNDLNAFDFIMNNQELEVYVMSIKVIRQLVLQRKESQQRLRAYHHPTTDLLADVWDHIHAGKDRIMWDLGLVEAIIHPEFAKIETHPAPPENKRKTVKVYTHCNVQAMEDDFWNSLDAYFKNH